MQDEKAEKISISLPSNLIAVIDAHEGNRSAYFQRIARADLKASGRLVNEDDAPVFSRAAALAAIIGDKAAVDFISQKLEEALAENAAKVA